MSVTQKAETRKCRICGNLQEKMSYGWLCRNCKSTAGRKGGLLLNTPWHSTNCPRPNLDGSCPGHNRSLSHTPPERVTNG